jgi:hypothetical protein
MNSLLLNFALDELNQEHNRADTNQSANDNSLRLVNEVLDRIILIHKERSSYAKKYPHYMEGRSELFTYKKVIN